MSTELPTRDALLRLRSMTMTPAIEAQLANLRQLVRLNRVLAEHFWKESGDGGFWVSRSPHF